MRALKAHVSLYARIQRVGEQDRTPTPPPPLEKHKNIEFVSNTGPDPLKNHITTKPAFNVEAIIGTPAKRHLNGVSLACR